MSRTATSLWDLVRATPRIDAAALARAVEDAACDSDDFRTRLLIRDSIRAIEDHWGAGRTNAWLSSLPHGAQIRAICEAVTRDAEPDEHGFPSLKRRIVDATEPATIHQFLRDLGQVVVKPTQMFIVGPIALILSGAFARRVTQVNIVDEAPEELRDQNDWLKQLDARYNLKLAQVPAICLPDGWADRCRSIGPFGLLQVLLVDLYDVFLATLFSPRSQDRDDLRAVLPHLDRSVLRSRLIACTATLRGAAKLFAAARANWYVLFGEELPGAKAAGPKKSRIMYVEFKRDGLSGPARIGRVTFSQTARSIYYQGKQFQSLKERGFKANYFDVETGEEYWISGCKRDGTDRLYGGDVEIDPDVWDEYWREIRKCEPPTGRGKVRRSGKYSG